MSHAHDNLAIAISWVADCQIFTFYANLHSVKPRPIMLKFLPIMLLSSAQNVACYA